MSLGELAMVVNSNFDKPLNEQARELAYAGSYLFVTSKSFTPDKTGWYKVIVVGAGGEGESHYREGSTSRICTGGSGGVAISTVNLKSTETYSVEVAGTQSSFNGQIIATSGTSGTASSSSSSSSEGSGGTAQGGDFNYSGLSGNEVSSNYFYDFYANGADVGVNIPELMRKETITSYTISDSELFTGEVSSGYGILGYGASNGLGYNKKTHNKGGCVLIIPLELEE